MRQWVQLPNYMGYLMEFYTSLTLFYTKMSFKILKFSNRPSCQSFSRAIYFSKELKNWPLCARCLDILMIYLKYDSILVFRTVPVTNCFHWWFYCNFAKDQIETNFKWNECNFGHATKCNNIAHCVQMCHIAKLFYTALCLIQHISRIIFFVGLIIWTSF
jgi:hypothetical protein